MDTVTLQQFQSHKDTTLKFPELITAITGASDQGKSSVIRAIKLVNTQRPTGNAYIRKKQKKCTVSIDDVTFIKTKSAGAYNLIGHEEPYKALRGKVPEAVTKELNLGEDNIQEQHNALFLLNLSPGKVALKLSELIDLDASVGSMKFLAHKKRGLSDDIKATQTAIEANERIISDLTYLDDVDKDLLLLEKKQKQVNRLSKKAGKIQGALDTTTKFKTRLDQLPDTSALVPARRIVKTYKEYMTLLKEETTLANAIENTQNLANVAQGDPTELLKFANDIIELESVQNTIAHHVHVVQSCQENAVTHGLKIAQLKEKHKKLMGSTCPLCNQKISGWVRLEVF